MPKLTQSQKLNIALVITATAAYLAVTLSAPKANQYHISLWAILLLTVTILGLWVVTIFLGLNAWLQLDRYAQLQSQKSNQLAYSQIASGVRLLAYGLLISSLFSASAPYFRGHLQVTTAISQINYYIIVITPFLGFLWLRQGSRRLATSAQAALSMKAKLTTVGPPVLVLAGFYVFLAATSSSPVAELPFGAVVLAVSMLLVIASWVFGLLAALNIERATHRPAGGTASGPLVKLYNGILTTTGGFIILDALLALGTSRVQALPLSLVVALLYGFIAVVGLGFFIVGGSARQLVAAAQKES